LADCIPHASRKPNPAVDFAAIFFPKVIAERAAAGALERRWITYRQRIGCHDDFVPRSLDDLSNALAASIVYVTGADLKFAHGSAQQDVGNVHAVSMTSELSHEPIEFFCESFADIFSGRHGFFPILLYFHRRAIAPLRHCAIAPLMRHWEKAMAQAFAPFLFPLGHLLSMAQNGLRH
jgi:hypothetical protein